MERLAANDLNFASLLRPGDRIVVGQATAEPLTLTRRLMAQEADLASGCRVFVGPVYSDTFTLSKETRLGFESYGAIGNAAHLARAGRLDVLPLHYSALGRGFADGSIRADCVLIQLAPGRNGRGFNLGLANDYLLDAARHARLVIAEINEDVPHCRGGEWPNDVRVDILIDAERPPLEAASAPVDETVRTIARNVASLVPDGAVLQFGVGVIAQAVAAGLEEHRDLGLHSGVMFDGVADLMERGALTNARKELDRGKSIAGLLIGTRRLYDFANDNRSVEIAPASHTHALETIARLSRFCAINSAVQVDLTGQVNAEEVDGRHVGAVGGQVDFVRGANASEGGRAIIALPSTARGGTVSRIVAQIATVTCARADVDVVVTEWGIAELRGCTLSRRAERMIAIAAPQFREDLARAWHEKGRAAHG